MRTTTPIIATCTGQVLQITAGVVSAGSILFATEALKMEIRQHSYISGIFEATVVVGAAVIAGETIMGYFTTTDAT